MTKDERFYMNIVDYCSFILYPIGGGTGVDKGGPGPPLAEQKKNFC